MVVLLGDVALLKLCVVADLLKNFFVFAFDLLDFAAHLVDLRVLNLDFLAVAFLLSLDLVKVVLLHFVNPVLVSSAFFFLLNLQLVKPR